MTERHGFTGGQLLIAAAGGALIGAVVALLLAPKTGAELRSKIKEKMSRMPETFGEATDAARDAFVDSLERS